jgi:alkylation response protein AidB-like acyl-CoA dehydrogenase
MNFSLAEEQQLLADALARFVERDYGFELRKTVVKSKAGWSRKAWTQLADLGVLGLLVPEAHGGFGGTSVDAMIVMNALGRGLVVEPYLQTAVLGATLVGAAGHEAQKAELLPGIAAGERVVVLAHFESDGAIVETRAQREGDEWRLSGTKRVVLHGGQADTLIVSARTDAGLGLFIVDPKSPHVKVRDYRTIDGLRAADIALDGAVVGADRVLGEPGQVDAGLALALDRATAALCAEAVGVMEELNRHTLEYIKTRQQFGQPIGRFQALQHRAADMFIDGEQSKSMAYLAAMKCASPDAKERGRAVSAAKAYIGRSGRRVAHEAIQLHGGMGVTDELPASHYAKRLRMVDFWLGNADAHVERFLALGE